MAQSQVLAKVSVLSGQAFARDSDGNLRPLRLGDEIREGESVVAANGAKVVLALADGREMTVRPGETAKLDAEVAAEIKPDATDSAVANDQTGFQKIASALKAGSDLDSLLEDDSPAAGLAQPGNEGHTFVELLRIVETVDPLAFQFSTGRDRPLETIEGGGQVLREGSVFNAGSDFVVDEAAGTITFTVTRSGPIDQAGSVSYTTVDGTALAGSDYTASSGILSFAAGESSKTITIALNNDTIFEGSETLSLKLGAPVNGTIGDDTQVATIVDDGRNLPGGPANDDRPVFNMGSDFVVDEAAGTVTFTVTKTGSTDLASSVSYGTVDGSATAGSDYTATSGVLNFAAGETVKTITVSITNDTLFEGPENFSVQLSGPVNATIGDGTQVATIVDDGRNLPGGPANDDRPVLSIGSDLIIDEAAGTVTFTVTKTGATTQAVSVDFASADGSATAGSDYTAVAGTLNFAANETVKTITVAITNDSQYEISETFTVGLSNPSNAVLGTAVVTGTIVDDGRTLPGGGTANDDRPGFSINDLTIDEAAGTATFTVTRTGDLSQSAAVDYAGQDGTATGADYSVTGGTLNFAANVATQTITVNIVNDAIFEGPESFNINLSNPVGAVIVDGQGVGTIVDDGRNLPGGPANDDRPVFNMGSDFVVDEAAGTVTFTVTKTGSTDLASSVSYGTVDGSATAGSDYTATSGVLNFAAGETVKTITVSITNDTLFEGPENFSVQLSGPVNATIGDGTQVATIVDDGRNLPGGPANDDRPVLSIGSDLIIDEAAGTVTFTVTKTGATTQAVSVDFASADGSATAGSDYTAVAGTLNFAANETVKTITVAITNDSQYEISETFTVGLSNPSNAVLGTAVVTGTIVDDGRTLPGGGTANDDRPGFSINDLTIDEAAGTATFTVTRTGDLSQSAAVDYAGQDGTATGADYSVTGGTLNFAANVATQTITVNIVNDAIFEGPESFNINLSNPVGAVIVDGQGVGTIVDDGRNLPGGPANDDRPVFNMGSDFVVDEAAGTVTFTVTKTGSTDLASSVSYGTVDGSATAGSDYTATSGVLNFAAGETVKTITVSITNDTLFEGPENFSVQLSGPVNATIGDGTQVATIVDDGRNLPGGPANDDRPVLSIGSDLIIDEAAGTVTFTVTKTGATTQAVSVDFASADGSATAGSDYTAVAGTLNFAANETVKTITVAITNDSQYEISETFTVGLSNPSNAVLGTAVVTGTIVDDGRTLPGGGTANDDRPGFSINDLTIDEAAGTATFTVTRTGDLSQSAAVDYAGQDGTATGADYSVTGGTLNFAANVATQTITVNIVNDAIFEGPESFNINLSNPVGAVIVDGQGVGTIVDDGRNLPGGPANDDRPVFNMGSDFVVDEAAGTVTFTVTKTGSTDLASSVSYGTVDGSATAGSDYTATSGVLNFAAGETVKTITVSITNDTLFEGPENFSVQLSGPVNATIGDGTQVATIVDDGRNLPGGPANDDRPVLSIGSDLIIDEAAGTVTFTVTKTGATTQAVSVDFASADGSATAGSDYTAVAGTLNFAANETVKTITVAITNDSQYEISETFTVGLSNPSNAVLGTAVVTGTIVDDGRTLPGGGTANDDRPGFSINDLTIDEAAGTATFTVTRTGDLSQSAAVDYAGQDGTATGADYSVTGGTLNFAANVATQTITVNIVNDAIFEGPESFNINLSNPVGAVIVDGQGVGTIVDDGRNLPGGPANDDRPVFNMGSDFVVDEAAGTVTFTVTKTGSTDLASSVSYGTVDGSATAGSDYTATSGVLNFAAGETVKTITVSITNDTLFEGPENFSVQLSGPVNATIGDGTQVATIVDDGRNLPGGPANDDRPVLSIGSDLIIDEAAGTVTFTVTKTGATTQAVSVDFASADGSATAGSDYTAVAGTLNFAANETVKTITVAITNDSQYEISETFTVGLSNPSNAVLGTAVVTGTIVDDGRTLPGGGTANDDRPGFSINDLTIDEAAGTATFTVTRTGDLSQSAAVDYAGQDGTATGADYSVTGGTLNFAANVATQTITVNIVNDAIFEGPESFNINLSNPVGAVIVDGQGVGTIVDDGRNLPGGPANDDRPVFNMGSDFVVDEAAGTVTFTVTKTGSTDLASSVSYGTVDGSATAGSDYTATSGVLNFAAGETVKTITVSITNDTLFEGPENFSVQLSGPVNATIGDGTQVATIVDDGRNLPGGPANDDRPVLSIGSDLIIDEAAGTVTFTVTKTGATTQAVSVDFASADGSATAGSDYTAVAGTLNFAANETVKTITVAITNDSQYEISETFTVGLSNPSNAVLGTAVVTGTIVDDGRTLPGGGTANDDRPGFSINDLTIDEAAGTATFTVTRTGDLSQSAAVDYAGQDGTATGADYSVTGGTLNFAANVATQTITVNIVNDAIFEGPESFNINLSNPVGAVIVDGQGVGTIVDDGRNLPGGPANDDRPVLTIDSPTVTEGGYAVFTASLSNASTSAVTFTPSLANGTAILGTDTSAASTLQYYNGTSWVSATGGVSIPAGSTSVQLRLQTTDDLLDEPNETFSLTGTVTSGNTQNASALGTATITDNDPTPSFSINDVTVNEAAGSATFTVTLSAPSGQATGVNWGLSDGTAQAGSDYTMGSGTLNFAAGVTTQTITVPILNDSPRVYEGAETFNVNLSGAVNATIADNLGIGTIMDDGTGSGGTDNDKPVLTIDSPTVTEGGYAVFTASLSNASTTAVTFTPSLANGTAILGTDTSAASILQYYNGTSWVSATGGVSIPAGSTSVQLRLQTTDDLLDEPNETFSLTGTVTSGNTQNASALGTATITDNDPTPSFSINDVTVNEAAGSATFTVTLSAPSGQATSVNWGLSDGTAQAGSDYTMGSGTLNFAAGVTTQTITVPILNDSPRVYEGAETFNVNLSGAVNATIADNLGIGTIMDDGTGSGGTDNDKPVLTIDSPTVTEGGYAVFTASLSNASTTAVTFTPSLANGTAILGTDTSAATTLQYYNGTSWVSATGGVSIPAGSTSVQLRLQTTDDLLVEADETFRLTGTVTSGNTQNASAVGTATILNNDTTPTVGTSTAAVSEEGLAGGNPDTTGVSDTTNSASYSGTIAVADADGNSLFVTLSTPVVSLTSNGQAVTWTGGGTQTLIGSAGGSEVIRISINNSGQYSVTLSKPVDHPVANVEDVLSFNVAVTASDTAQAGTGTLTIQIEDDAPYAFAQTRAIDLSQQDTNLMVILDVSGSMTSGTVDRLAAARTAITNLINSYDGRGDVAVKIVTFSTLAADKTSYWMTADDAKAMLASITASGYTNYDAALAQAIESWGSAGRILNAPAGGTLNNVAYFISDGQPNENDGNTGALVNSSAGANNGPDAGIQAAEEVIWQNFLVANSIKAFALGIGTGLTATDQTYLNPVAFDGQTNTNLDAYMVSDVNLLSAALQATVVPVATGNVLSGATPGSIGADGGHLSSIAVDGVTFSWNSVANTISTSGAGTATASFDTSTHVVTVTTANGGLLNVDMDNGEYSYRPPFSGSGTLTQAFGFTLLDNDGDSGNGSVTMNVTYNEGAVTSIGTASGNTITGTAGNDIISGLAGDDVINGGDGNDWLSGGDGNDTLNGGNGDDRLVGGNGNDILNGGAGNDLLIGGTGNDTMTGGLGSDTFQWSFGDKGTIASVAVDTITDFNVALPAAGGDILNLRDLLVGEANNGASLDNYLHFNFSGGNTTLYISATGAFSDNNSVASNPGNVTNNDVQQIVFTGVNLTTGFSTDQQVINDLISKGKLITD